MTELATLRGKNSREAARVLAALSSSLLPQPGISELLNQPGVDPDILQSVITEIRHHLRVPDGDFSMTTQSKIYAFVSSEISKAALADTSEKGIKDRLGNKGELRPNQYEVVINDENTRAIEALGNKKFYVIDAITHPDEVRHLQASYATDDNDLNRLRPTISTKSINGKRSDDDFILLIISFRKGQTQQVQTAFRVYRSEVDVGNMRDPNDILKAFVDTYGLTFQFGNKVSRYIENEVVGVSPIDKQNISLHMKPLEGSGGDHYFPVIAGAETRIQGLHSETMTIRILFAFVVNIAKYAMSMRRHRVQLTPEDRWKFRTI